MKNFIAAVALSLMAIAAVAPQAAAQVSTPDPAAVKGGAYKVDPSHTQVIFSISHLGFTNFYGAFSGVTGGVQLDPATPANSKLNVVIPVRSIQTTVPQLTEELKGDQWFAAAKFPNASFTSTQVVITGPGTANVVGDFTLHGITKPVTLTARLVGSGVNPLTKATTAGFEATAVLKRSDFGIKQYLPMLGDDVHLTVVGAFEKQP
jgi:polyisoprenoid-binding protein YceI